jgi:hypothetical protein
MEQAMLPPVHAALSSNIDFQSQPQVAVSRARVEVSASALQSDAEKSSAISGARSDAISLSAQLKLAQGSSIFAETIGKLLKTPRRENEALLDYTTRLFDAVQALKPAEVANVERLLNQIVKGISLRILAEVLREPTGPAAARLAVYIETANIAERDLATNAVVSSYRQNASTDPAPVANVARISVNGNTPGAAAGPAAQVPAAADGTQASDTPETIANAAMAKNADGESARSGSSQPPAATPDRSAIMPKAADGQTGQANTALSAAPAPSAEQSEGAEKASLPPSSAPEASNPRASTSQAGIPPAALSQAGIPPAALSQAGISQTALSQPMAAQAGGEDGLPLPAGVAAGALVDAALRQQAAAAGDDQDPQTAIQLQEADAWLQVSDEGQENDMPVPVRLWTSLSDQAVAKLASWAAAIADNPDAPAPGQAATTSAQIGAPAEDGIDPQQTGDIPFSRNSPLASSQQPSADASRNTALADASDNIPTAAPPVSARQTAEQSLAAASAAIPVAPREAPPWPYVAAYPPAEEEPRREGRKTPPVFAIEDEEQDGSSEQHAFQNEEEESGQQQEEARDDDEIVAREEKTAAEKAAGYTVAEAMAEEKITEGRPSDLYWRMAGWN